jgi:heme oxygenase
MILERLKNRTRAQHLRLENLAGLPVDRLAHATLLSDLFGFVSAWEERLARLLPPEDSLRAGRGKTAWLEADLESLGVDAAARSALPRCAEEALPAGATRAELLGVCYVFEGATLGGQFIARHLRERLGAEAGEGDRYFLSYGAEVGARWREFGAELARHSSPENDPVIERAAGEAFERLADWFAERRGAREEARA